jgi:alkylation response protein AidB-like acyl-CoA dehydrogenase
VPVDELTIEDTWSAPGLRGRGSHPVSAHAVDVDLERSCRFSDTTWPAGELWRLPIYTLLIPMLASVPIGIARGAVDEVLALAREGRSARRGNLHEDPVGMAELAVIDTNLRAMTALLRESLEEARAVVDRGDLVDRAAPGPHPPRRHARMRRGRRGHVHRPRPRRRSRRLRG